MNYLISKLRIFIRLLNISIVENLTNFRIIVYLCPVMLEDKEERGKEGKPLSRYLGSNLNFKAIVAAGWVTGKSRLDRHRLMIDTLIGDLAEP